MTWNRFSPFFCLLTTFCSRVHFKFRGQQEKGSKGVPDAEKGKTPVYFFFLGRGFLPNVMVFGAAVSPVLGPTKKKKDMIPQLGSWKKIL